MGGEDSCDRRSKRRAERKGRRGEQEESDKRMVKMTVTREGRRGERREKGEEESGGHVIWHEAIHGGAAISRQSGALALRGDAKVRR
jgi:hypothetical protein